MFKIITLFLLINNIIKSTPLENFETTNYIEIIQLEDINKIEQSSAISYSNKQEDIARKFLQEYKSLNPVILLVDNTRQSNKDAENFIKNVFKLSKKAGNINFILMKFNTSGVSPILETTQHNRINFMNILNSKKQNEPTSFLGYKNLNKTAAFFGILNAAYILPPHCGIVVFVDRGPDDEDIAEQALIEVRKKGIRVYVIWGGFYEPPTDEERILEELTAFSGGKFFINTNRNLSDQYHQIFIDNAFMHSTVSTVLSKKNLTGEKNLEFPVNSDVTGIHISITPNITNGILITPQGYRIDVLEGEEVAQYTEGSFAIRDTQAGIHEIHLNTTTATSKDVGIWRLRINNARASYNITIFVYSKITTDATLVTINKTDSNGKKIIKLDVTGDVSLINSVSFVNPDGKIIKNNQYKLDKNWEDYQIENIYNNETNQKEIELNIENIPNEPFYAIINGKDTNGHNFTRLSYVKQYGDNSIFQLLPLTIDVGVGSELLVDTNRHPQIFFEVTNNGNKAFFVRLLCNDEKSILYSMNPWNTWISPQETATVRVTLRPRPGSYQDLITLTAQGPDSVQKRVLVDIGRTQVNDQIEPQLYYKYTSDCTDFIFSSCDQGTWTIEVRAKDTQSGLLQLVSRPKGLYFPNGYTSGTKDEVIGYYSDSCCNPDIQLIAVDRQNNKITRNANAYRANLGVGAIAAIILGIVLFIIIIIIIIFLVKKCCSKDKESFDLPSYRGPKRAK